MPLALYRISFNWEPTREYDLVFFANWLSQVPPGELSKFLAKAVRAARPGGYIAILDQYAPMPEDRQIMQEGEDGNIYAHRTLQSGADFTIVKMFYNVAVLQEIFSVLGCKATTYKLDDSFFFLEAQRD